LIKCWFGNGLIFVGGIVLLFCCWDELWYVFNSLCFDIIYGI